MSEENLNPTSEPKNEIPGSENKSSEKKERMISIEEMEGIIKKRVAKERESNQQREDDLSNQINQLKTQLGESKKNTSVSSDNNGSENKNNEQMIPASELPGILDYAHQRKSFQEKIKNAIEKDAEFKKLSETEGSYIDGNVLGHMMHLENSPAVVKHLMKNPKDKQLAILAAQQDSFTLTKFLNELSNKLDVTQERPGPSSFEPTPPLSEGVSSAQDFDEKSYIKEKYKNR